MPDRPQDAEPLFLEKCEEIRLALATIHERVELFGTVMEAEFKSLRREIELLRRATAPPIFPHAQPLRPM